MKKEKKVRGLDQFYKKPESPNETGHPLANRRKTEFLIETRYPARSRTTNPLF